MTTDLKKLTPEQEAFRALWSGFCDMDLKLATGKTGPIWHGGVSRWSKEYDLLSKLVDTHAGRSQPVPSGELAGAVPSIVDLLENVAHSIYRHVEFGNWLKGRKVPWVKDGNSDAQELARGFARMAMAEIIQAHVIKPATVEPIDISEARDGLKDMYATLNDSSRWGSSFSKIGAALSELAARRAGTWEGGKRMSEAELEDEAHGISDDDIDALAIINLARRYKGEAR